MKQILTFSVIATLALCTPILAATNASNGGEIGFQVGEASLSNSDTTGSDSAQLFGVRGGYHINKQFQVEGQFASSSDSATVSGTSVDSTMHLYMVNGVMNFHPRKKELMPYVMAGVGRAEVSVDAPGSSISDNSTAYQVGGGTRIFFGKSMRMAFRADLSFLKETAFSASTTSTNLMAGISWKLGGR